MCIRNFFNRRGTPREIFTDNGTNFKASEKVICEELPRVVFDEVYRSFDTIKWSFNPPSAPHMGGAWERLIGSIKRVLSAICPAMKFTSESLQSALWEIEFIINSRPLTFVSLDTNDDEAITPNHLLLGSVSGYKPKRWVREYVPDLARRGKWYAKQPPLTIGSRRKEKRWGVIYLSHGQGSASRNSSLPRRFVMHYVYPQLLQSPRDT